MLFGITKICQLYQRQCKYKCFHILRRFTSAITANEEYRTLLSKPKSSKEKNANISKGNKISLFNHNNFVKTKNEINLKISNLGLSLKSKH